jgi:hypothetical protein
MNQGINPSIIPFRINKSVAAKNSIVNEEDYFVTESKEGYMCTVEYIALSTAYGAIELKVLVYDFNVDAKGKVVLAYQLPFETNGTHFFTKIRMEPGEVLNIKALNAKEPVNVHVSGYYELIPKLPSSPGR